MMMLHPLILLTSLLVWSPVLPCELESELPYNAHQVEEGYWLGGRPGPSNVRALRKKGITRVVSLVKLSQDTRDALKAAGISQTYLRFGSKFPTPSRVDIALGKIRPEQTYIHCHYGADRTGVLLAYLLATRHGWDIPSSFLAVVRTGKRWGDEELLRELLEEEGYDTAKVKKGIPGIFSPRRGGGDGGLKAGKESYRRLVRKTISRIKEARRDVAQ
ncbi:MAG: protein-tyrosine phosphatase family protein [Planctomycetota bacterium]|jgi:hypothetical protein